MELLNIIFKRFFNFPSLQIAKEAKRNEKNEEKNEEKWMPENSEITGKKTGEQG